MHTVETLELLGAALGLGALSGLSLYLTVFVVGMSLDAGWLVLKPGLEPLHALADPWVWGIALVFYMLEFFADKVPWVDSLWDSFHTAIRPVGAMFIAATALGESHASMEIVGALLAGTAALAMHTTKAGARLLINTSPEPFSNMGASMVEDVVVVAGSMFTIHHPIAMLFIVCFAMGAFVWCAPRLFRFLKAHILFVAGKLGAGGRNPRELPRYLPHEIDLALSEGDGKGLTVAWAVPCFTGKMPAIGSNLRGYLVALDGGRRICFAGKRGFARVSAPVPLEDARAEYRQRFLFDEVVFYRAGAGVLASFRFLKRDSALASLAVLSLDVEKTVPEAPASAPDAPADGPDSRRLVAT